LSKAASFQNAYRFLIELDSAFGGGRPRRDRFYLWLTPLVFIVLWTRWRMLIDLLEQLRIEHRRADAIASAGPLPQIDQTTAIAAERKVLVGTQHNGPARRTAQTESFLSSHKSIDQMMRATRS
jgi:hypothetical protein